MTITVDFNAELLTKYNQPIPRYTSYPPATELKPEFDSNQFLQALELGNQHHKPLSLYCHIPFCETPCYFCGCNTIITQYKPAAIRYLDYLIRQIQHIAPQVSAQRIVNQLHWGGGTPNYLAQDQVVTLWQALTTHFTFAEDAEISIEINSRYVDRDYIQFLRQLGFNRISFGIQDFNPTVQEAINRVQPEAMLFDVMAWIREAGFASVNVDLIYGLPYQTIETFQATVAKTIQLNPDRIAVFNFAYIPWLKPLQKRMPASEMPDAAAKLRILHNTISQLTGNGYSFIGMDHFAKPNDELSLAQQAGQLHRNFQGYTTKPEADLLGFGMTSISMLQNVYTQNHKRLQDYYQAVDAGAIPIERGVTLTEDDLIRRAVIMELMCQFRLSLDDLNQKYQLGLARDFNDYFADALPKLDGLEADGLLRRFSDGLEVTPKGRLLIRNIAAVFDAYLVPKKTDIFCQAI
ncbi:oxygen-independent coproporphyrinogen III oxidase [Thermosynechococcaceae cyanobacterium BACA0444]|uniref:Coproporphyrinogen-III oxidase n=1 Tax=Pseudocalidococcus azoricus BACA0444 TaxID=2918990 RepID=A0AAE4FR72_9CYAN|nr:oxygen-independent coproporphyrinogen III oxidase [Pseudocalidococcus azoricus]MDS3860032.1 oxygen-independent coproporphyrinogen III oxidase [Pseudocalidococcus azoricus BACA0444]